MKVLTLTGVREGRRQNDPVDPNRYVFTGMFPAEQINKLARDSGVTPWANPRMTGANQKMAKVIRKSFVTERGKFHDLNRGPALVADHGKLDKEVLSITFAAPTKRGLVDGGTTVTALAKELENGFQQSEDEQKLQFVNIRVFCGPRTDADVDDLVEALNTNKQVDAISLANFSGAFEWVKKLLAKKSFPAKVSYFDGDTGEYEVDEIIQMLSLFVMDDPTEAYVSKQTCLENFRENPASYEKYADVLVDVLYLSEQIPTVTAEKYNKGGGKFAALEMIGGDKSKREPRFELPLLKKTINFTPRNAWVYPILASFKAALDTSKGTAAWKVGGADVLDAVALDLFEKVKRSFDKSKNLNYGVGRNSDLYENLFGLVEKQVEKMLVRGKTARIGATA
jgi:hypothetical protein